MITRRGFGLRRRVICSQPDQRWLASGLPVTLGSNHEREFVNAEYTVIVPYYCEAEIARYMTIADQIERLGRQSHEYRFLLAASPRTRLSRELEARLSELAPVDHFQCPTRIFGYPAGPTAMFWDCMDWMDCNSRSAEGFGLWFESDMVPVRENWLDLIVADWHRGGQPWLMGCVIPEIYRNRLFKTTPPKWTEEHVNGGACYCRHFARHLPPQAREDVFDLAVYPYCQEANQVRATETISLSTMNRCRMDISNSNRAVLHGFLQNKEKFLSKCLRLANRCLSQWRSARDCNPGIWPGRSCGSNWAPKVIM